MNDPKNHVELNQSNQFNQTGSQFNQTGVQFNQFNQLNQFNSENNNDQNDFSKTFFVKNKENSSAMEEKEGNNTSGEGFNGGPKTPAMPALNMGNLIKLKEVIKAF